MFKINFCLGKHTMEISHPMISDQVYEKTLERSLIFAHLHLETVKGKKIQFFLRFKKVYFLLFHLNICIHGKNKDK